MENKHEINNPYATRKINDVPYIVHEGTVDRFERIIRRMWILCIIMFLAFVISNSVWIWYDSQFETSETTTTIEAEQTAAADDGDAIINDGVNISNGDGKTESQNN